MARDEPGSDSMLSSESARQPMSMVPWLPVKLLGLYNVVAVIRRRPDMRYTLLLGFIVFLALAGSSPACTRIAGHSSRPAVGCCKP